MSRSRAKSWRSPVCWLTGVTLFALAPKCLVCLAAYAGIGAVFGVKLASPELCGAGGVSSSHTLLWSALGVAGFATILLFQHHSRRVRARG